MTAQISSSAIDQANASIGHNSSEESSAEDMVQKIIRLEEERNRYRNEMEQAFAKHQEMMLLCFTYINTSDDDHSNLPEEIKDFREELKHKLQNEFLRIFPDSNIPRFLERVCNVNELSSNSGASFLWNRNFNY
jgi:hypothetical protein